MAKDMGAGNRQLASFLGEKTEEWAEENRGVACLNGTVDGELMEGDLSVEVKGCCEQYHSGRVGRLRFWKRQHQELREVDGVYLIVVYNPDAQEPVQRDRWVHWSSLEQIMEEGGYSWYSADGHTMWSEQTQIRWNRFFPELS